VAETGVFYLVNKNSGGTVENHTNPKWKKKRKKSIIINLAVCSSQLQSLIPPIFIKQGV